MSAKKLFQSARNLAASLNRLEETQGRSTDQHPFLIDATIQRVECCLEVDWKTLRRLLAYVGMADVASPRAALKHACQQGWLRDEATWLGMLDGRHRTSHVYSEDMVREIFDRMALYVPEMRSTFETLRQDYAHVMR